MLDSAGGNYDLLDVSRVDSIIYTLITNQYATYKELRDDYDIYEVLDLYEICLTNIYNRSIIMKEMKNG